jgi:hypothetical protein
MAINKKREYCRLLSYISSDYEDHLRRSKEDNLEVIDGLNERTMGQAIIDGAMFRTTDKTLKFEDNTLDEKYGVLLNYLKDYAKLVTRRNLQIEIDSKKRLFVTKDFSSFCTTYSFFKRTNLLMSKTLAELLKE